jgi:inosine/xanthosine triphosphatase
MRVVIASRNPVKLAAGRKAFEALFPDENIDVIAVDAESGVADQPSSDGETRTGARNRAEHASRAESDADFWVGLEGGIDVTGEQLMAFAWMHVRGSNGFSSEARSVSLPLPPRVKQLVDEGLELGEANDRVFATLNSKHGGGAFGLLTDGRVTRESVYAETMMLALMPFVNPLFPHASSGIASD